MQIARANDENGMIGGTVIVTAVLTVIVTITAPRRLLSKHAFTARSFNQPLFAALLSAALLLASGSAHALRIGYIVDLAAEHNDNLLLTSKHPIALTFLRPSLAFDLHEDSSTVQADISGRMAYVRYGDRRFGDSLDSTLNGRVNWNIIPQRLSFNATDHLTLQPVNTLTPDTPGNRQQVNVFSAGPTVHFQWSQRWQGTAELQYVRNDAEVTDIFNAQRYAFALRSTRLLSATSALSLSVQTQQVDFDDDIRARDYRRDDLFARYTRKLANVDLRLDFGFSRLDYRRAFPGLADTRHDPLLHAEILWRLNESHRLRVRASRESSDVANDALFENSAPLDGTPSARIPERVVTGQAVVNASPFLEQRLDTEYAYTSPRWTFKLSPYVDHLRYNDSNTFDQNSRGATVASSWRARPHLLLGALASIDHDHYVRQNRNIDTTRYTINARYEATRHWSSTLEFSRDQRRSDFGSQNADQNAITLTFTYRNR